MGNYCLMAGADQADVVRRWRDLAMRQQQLHLRGNYAVLALVFAEMTGRKLLWQTGLEGFNMQESTIMRQWREEAAKQGRDAGLKEGRDKGLKEGRDEGLKEGLKEGRDEGLKEGLKEGTLMAARAAVLNVLQARFPETPLPEGVRGALEKNADVRQLNDWLREAALTASPADFERFLAAAPN